MTGLAVYGPYTAAAPDAADRGTGICGFVVKALPEAPIYYKVL